MNKLTLSIVCMATALLLNMVSSFPSFSKDNKGSETLNIRDIQLGCPLPGIPFYHFTAKISLDKPSIIEVEASVDGKILRATDIRRDADHENMNRPPLSERPPSGYGLSQDGTLYKDFNVTGWVRWEPGKEYTIKLSVRLKKSARASVSDTWATASVKVKAPSTGSTFSSKWKNYKSIVVSETAGIARKAEPVEVLLAFYPDEAQQLSRDIRVMAVDPETHALTEVPSQVYDRQEYLVVDDQAPGSDGKPTRPNPLWMPTVSTRVAFLADVPAKSSKVFLVFYNNPDALPTVYQTDLRVQGEVPGLQVNNDKIEVILHPASGHLDQVSLKSKPDAPLYHRLETNGAMHWNPDIYIPPRPWTHTADWKPARNISSVAGPVITRIDMNDAMREVPEVDAAVSYEFYPGMPYFKSSTCMRINETVQALALRNAEMVIKRELITHAAWYDIVRDSVIVYNVSDMPDLTDLKMEADVPWIMFFNKENGIAFAGIQLEYSNTGIEAPTRLLNPFFYITAGPWVYWARGLSHTFLSSNMQQVVPVPKGNVFSEKWAYLTLDTKTSPTPYAEVIEWQKRLTNPLRIQLVEEVDDRVSKTLHEVFMDDGKSGWEGRDTHK